jgi:hypothetical protein
MRSIKFDWDIKVAQVTEKDRANDPPLKLSVPAAKGRHRQRLNPPLLIVKLKVVKASHYVTKAAHGTPVLFSWKVDDQVVVGLINIRFTQLHFMPVTAPDVVLVHIRITFLEAEGDALTHDAHGIDGVNEGMHV